MATNSGKRTRQIEGWCRSTAVRRIPVAEILLVLATNPDYESLCAEAVKKLPSHLRSIVFSPSAKRKASSSSRSTLIVSRLADLSCNTVQHLANAATTKQVVFIHELPIEAVTVRLISLQIRSSQRLHIASKRDRVAEGELIYRLVSGMAEQDGSKTIVDAWIEGEDLVLLSPSFDRMVVSSEKLSRFLDNDLSKFSNFEIDEDGRFLRWPHSDTHLGWKQLEQLNDPSVAIEDLKKTEQFRASYGNAIRSLRELSSLKQADVTGITTRQLRRIEHGEQTVTSNSLEALAAAHALPIDEYMRKLAALATKAP